MAHDTKALFFDIDGTLLDWKSGIGQVPEGAQRELRRIQALGHRLFVSSGRPWAFIDEHLRSLGFDGYVLLNGAHVELGDETIYEERMSEHEARAAADAFAQAGSGYAVDTAHHVYIDPSFSDTLSYLSGHSASISFSFERGEVLGRTLKLESRPTPEQRAAILEQVTRELGSAVRCDDNGTDGTFEVYSARLSKASGIMCVLDRLGISPQDAYGFGDGLNDLEMIRLVGCGVAMGNGADELKAAADVVCGRVDEGGLEQILRELF
ncbi:MAG: HAD-IIB family hydrolase [Coriobacteriales bacterium]|nr:HAD-IIB family hydrolase [Coriobacteriales bacterium]